MGKRDPRGNKLPSGLRMRYAGSAVVGQDLLFALEELVREQKLLGLLEAQPGDGVGEALLGLAVGLEQQQALLHQSEHLLPIGDDHVQGPAHGGALAPAAADIDPVAGGLGLDGLEGTLGDAAAAAVALLRIDDRLAVHHLGHMDGAGLLTDLAALAQLRVDQGDPLAHDAHVVQIRLDAVVGAAAHGDLEFVRQDHIVVAVVIQLVELFGQSLGVVQAKDTGSAFAADHRTHFGAGAACDHPRLGHVLLERFDVVVMDPRQLHCQAGGKGDFAIAEFFSGFAEAFHLFGRQDAVLCDDTAGKFLRTTVEQETLSFDTLDVTCCNCHNRSSTFFSFIKSAFKRNREVY